MCRAPDPQRVSEDAVRCANCSTWMSECPTCQGRRCRPEIHFSMVGSIPLACLRCRPDGVDQTFEFDLDAPGVGPYRGGARLMVDGEERFRVA